jgi:hypothetical protein
MLLFFALYASFQPIKKCETLVNYSRNSRGYLYLEDLKSGDRYNVKGINDNIFHTGACTVSKPFNRDGYFYFIKSRHELKGKSVGNIPLKKGPVLFIVKTKN